MEYQKIQCSQKRIHKKKTNSFSLDEIIFKQNIITVLVLLSYDNNYDLK